MKNYIKGIGFGLLVLGLSFMGARVTKAVSPCSVPFGCTGVSTITGIPYGTGTSALGIVTIGSGVSFSGGVLSATGSGGTVTSVSGTSNRITVATGTTTPVIDISATFEALLGKVANPLSQFASTTSAQLAGVISDETGSGKLVFATSPTFTTPTLGSASASGLTLSSITGATQCLRVNSSGVISGTGSDCGSGGSSLNIGFTTITGGSSGNVIYNNAGVVGEMTTSGSGTQLALTNSPTFVTPALGTPASGVATNLTGTATALNIGGNAATATILQTTRTLNGVSFNGSADITIPSDIVPGTSGNVLTSNGSVWTSATPAAAPGNASYAAKGLVQGLTDATTSGLTIASGVISVNSGTSANNIVKLDGSSKLPAVDGSALTNLPTQSNNQSTLVAGATITAGQALTSYWYQSDGGVTLDTKDKSSGVGVSSLTKSFTVGNHSNRGLVVTVETDQVPSSVTFNGSSKTLVTSQAIASSFVLYTYYLSAPAVATANVVANLPGSGTIAMVINSYYNVLQSGQPIANNKATAATNTVNAAVSTTTNGSLMIASGGVVGAGGSLTGTLSSITNAPSNFQAVNNLNNTIATDIADSGIVYQATSYSLTQTIPAQVSGSITSAITQIVLQPFTTATSAVNPGSSSNVTVTGAQNLYTAFMGFASSSVSAGSNESVITSGVVTGLSGLTPNTDYFLNDTSGTIGTSAGTNSRKVGISLSTTTLLITNIW